MLHTYTTIVWTVFHDIASHSFSYSVHPVWKGRSRTHSQRIGSQDSFVFNFCYRPLGYRPLVQVLHATMKSGVASPKPTNKFYSQAKVVKLRIHPRNFSGKKKSETMQGRVSTCGPR